MPSFHILPGRAFEKDGTEWLYFSGTSYLGIPHNPDFRTFLIEGIEQYGSNFGGSRLSNSSFYIFEEAEAYLAKWAGAPAALTISSGTLAGQLCAKVLSQQGLIHYAPGSHPALDIQGEIPDISFAAWSARMVEKSYREKAPLILATNSVDPLRMEDYDFRFIKALNRNAH
mgnify:FL=1